MQGLHGQEDGKEILPMKTLNITIALSLALASALAAAATRPVLELSQASPLAQEGFRIISEAGKFTLEKRVNSAVQDRKTVSKEFVDKTAKRLDSMRAQADQVRSGSHCDAWVELRQSERKASRF